MQWATESDHLQQPFLAREQTLGAFEIVDIGLQQVPVYDFAFGIPQRLAVDLEPAIYAIGYEQVVRANGGNTLDRRNCEILCHRDSLMTAALHSMHRHL